MSKVHQLLLAVIVVVPTLCGCGSGGSSSGAPAAHPPPAVTTIVLTTDIQYTKIPGIDPSLLSLDIYAPSNADGTNPVMIMYHGGGYIGGDKAGDDRLIHPKMDYYTAQGWIFLSVNYRLTDPGLPIDHPDQVTHPDHVEDVASSIAWTKTHISEFGGDPSRMVLVGFSAGAHLVALVATDERRLADWGIAVSELDGVVALDAFYDVPRRIPQAAPFIPLALGEDTETQLDASPIHHVAAGKGIPPILVVYQNAAANIEQGEAFVNSLLTAGVLAEGFLAEGKTHVEIGGDLGIEGDPLTIAVDRFLTSIGF